MVSVSINSCTKIILSFMQNNHVLDNLINWKTFAISFYTSTPIVHTWNTVTYSEVNIALPFIEKLTCVKFDTKILICTFKYMNFFSWTILVNEYLSELLLSWIEYLFLHSTLQKRITIKWGDSFRNRLNSQFFQNNSTNFKTAALYSLIEKCNKTCKIL